MSRQRILDSAIKVMSLYAGGRAVLELEYFGEAGTGLGPTLEFFTLLSHELQRKGLGMWRSDHSGAAPLTLQLHNELSIRTMDCEAEVLLHANTYLLSPGAAMSCSARASA